VGGGTEAAGNIAVLLNDGAWPDANAPTINISDVTVTEGNAGTVNAALTVTLSKASTKTVTVFANIFDSEQR